jgi:CBS-domain-containing membrane protein
MSATVKDVITSRVVAVRKNAPFKDIAKLLTRYQISALPVLDDDGKVIGVVSDRARDWGTKLAAASHRAPNSTAARPVALGD